MQGRAKIILGAGSPVPLVTPEVSLQDLQLPTGDEAGGDIRGGLGWAAIVIEGQGSLRLGDLDFPIGARDFIVHQGEYDTSWEVRARESLRMIWIRVPLTLPYGLFPKPR